MSSNFVLVSYLAIAILLLTVFNIIVEPYKYKIDILSHILSYLSLLL